MYWYISCSACMHADARTQGGEYAWIICGTNRVAIAHALNLNCIPKA